MSVIVPVYNVAQYLDKCVSSIVCQSLEDIEIIMIDDGSTDESGRICDRFSRMDERIRVVHQENVGLAATRKKAVSIACGEYISFVDGDDWIDIDFLSRLYCLIKNDGKKADLVTSVHIRDHANGSQISRASVEDGIYDRDRIQRDILPRMIWDYSFNGCGIVASLCVKLFRRELLQDIMSKMDISLTIGEDGAVMYPFLLASKRVIITHYAGYHYVMRESSMLHKLKCDKFVDVERLHTFMNNRFEELGYRYQLQDQINQYTWSCLQQVIWSVYDLYPHELVTNASLPPIIFKKKIVLYGAGRIGKRLYKLIKSNQWSDIVAWIDNSKETFLEQMPIYPPEMLKELEYDYVLIGVGNNEIVDEIIRELIGIGVNKESILWIKQIES
ncbi:MAG: glycosyltransferase [Lachnospiraceae bacterium]|nr:glycosyltransferase [Lachnospiraceae bacterium]